MPRGSRSSAALDGASAAWVVVKCRASATTTTTTTATAATTTTATTTDTTTVTTAATTTSTTTAAAAAATTTTTTTTHLSTVHTMHTIVGCGCRSCSLLEDQDIAARLWRKSIDKVALTLNCQCP